MFLTRCYAVLGIFLGCHGQSLPLAAPGQDQVSVLLDKVAVLYEYGRPICSGAFLDNGRVLSAAHCYDPDVTISVASYDGHKQVPPVTWAYECESIDEESDLVTLRPQTEAPLYWSPFELGRGDLPRGTDVATIGHPLGFLYSWSSGVVSLPRFVDDDGVWIMATVPTWFGNSGGPLIAGDGKLYGIASFIVNKNPTLAFYAHTDSIRYHLMQPLAGCL